MYSIIYSDKVRKQLKKLPQNIQQRIIYTIERCRIRPSSYIKKLVGNPYFSLRVGKYRIIMRIIKNELKIFVIEVGHRKNIYKN